MQIKKPETLTCSSCSEQAPRPALGWRTIWRSRGRGLIELLAVACSKPRCQQALLAQPGV